jgi:PadR family transcriptional regulator, regulatory protein AphA
MGGRKGGARSTTAEALLGLLSVAPMSGYEVRQMIAESIGNFWTESYGQIYPGLKKLVSDGLAEVKEERAEGRPAKKVYSLTERGQERLREWLGMPVERQVPRNELLLKMFFGDKAEYGVLRAQVEARRAVLAANLARYWAIEKRIHGFEDVPGKKFWLMTVRYGIAETQALIAWCDGCLKEME